MYLPVIREVSRTETEHECNIGRRLFVWELTGIASQTRPVGRRHSRTSLYAVSYRPRTIQTQQMIVRGLPHFDCDFTPVSPVPQVLPARRPCSSLRSLLRGRPRPGWRTPDPYQGKRNGTMQGVTYLVKVEHQVEFAYVVEERVWSRHRFHGVFT